MNLPSSAPPAAFGTSSRRTWIVLAVALLLGALSAALSLSYLQREKSALQAQSGKFGNRKVQLIVPKRNLARGDALTAETVAVREVPAEFAHSLALRASDFSHVDGRLLAYPLKSGEAILPALVQGGEGTFSSRVDPGRRAVTLPVDEISSISGLLEPGDLIDLMLTVEQGGRRAAPLLVLQGVQVMATGQRVENDPRTGEARRYTAVTLDTTPQQARNVITARELGKLTALLRNPHDKPTGASEEFDVGTLVRPVGAPAAEPARAASPREVAVLYGGAGNHAGRGRLTSFGRAGADRSTASDTPPIAGDASPPAAPAP